MKKKNKIKGIFLNTFLVSCLFVCITLIIVFGFCLISPVKASAAISTTPICTTYGNYEYDGTSYSGCPSSYFEVKMYGSSTSGIKAIFNDERTNWGYYTIKVFDKNISKHISFKLYMDNYLHTSKTLSNNGDLILYSGTLLDGEYRLEYVCSVGNKNYTYNYRFEVDNTAPTDSLKAGGSNISSGSYTNKQVVYSATDKNRGRYYVQTPSASSYGVSYESSLIIDAKSSNNGWWYMYALDSLDNKVSEKKIYMDVTPPSGAFYGGSSPVFSGGYTNANYIKYVASDAHSGIYNCYVAAPKSGVFTSYTSGTHLTAEGIYSFYCVDKAGNATAVSSITLDRSNPSGMLYGGSTSKSTGSYTNADYVKYTATDSGSGVNNLYVKMPNTSLYTDYSSGIQLATEGTYSFYCVDKAGNQSSVVTITLDKTKPTGRIVGDANNISEYTNARYIKFIASDSSSGVNNCYVKKPNATSYTSYISGTELTAQGTYTFYCTDKAGNTSEYYTVTVDRQAPSGQLYVDGKVVSNGIYTNEKYIKFVCSDNCYVMMPDSSTYIKYVSGTEFEKAGKYIFYASDVAGNASSKYTIVIDRIIKQVNISHVTNCSTNGDVKITWTNGDANSFAPIKSVTVNGKSVSNGATVYTIDTGNYVVKVVDAAGNEWQTSFKSTKKNVLTDTLVKEFFEATDINGDPFAFTTYEKALEFATARENSKVKTAEWNNSTWDTGVPMDTVDAANAKNGTYFIYYKSGNPDELVAYFTTERLKEVIAEYAKKGIVDYYYWEKTPATAGPNENLYSYSANRNILAKEVMLGENIGVTVDGEVFVGSVYNTEGKHVMVISDSYGNTCEYNLTVIRTLPDLYYAIGEGEAVKVDLERTYYFKDGISISITDALDEMAMFNVYDENGDLIGSYSLGEFCTLTESGTYTAVSVNHMGESEEFKIVISRNAPSVDLKADEVEKQLVITATKSADDGSYLQTLEVYKSTDGGETWNLLDTDDYGTAVELNNFVYKFRTSGMYKIVITDEFRTGMDAITGQISYTQPAPTGDLEGVTNGGHTNKEVTFTWEDEAKVTVTKDGEVIEYKSGDKLTDDGSYTITFENFDGAKTSYEFVIDTEPVAIVAEGNKANLPVANPVTVNFTEEDVTAVLIKDGKEVGAYVSGTAVSDEGDYIVRVTDEAGNVSEIAFEIDKSVDFAVNVNDSGLSNSVVIEANEGAEIIVTKDGNVIEYKEGTAITEPGKYTVKVTDALDNTVERSFIIVTPVSTSFTHSFDETAGFEKVIINGEETRLNYGALELTEDGTYEVGVVVNGKTYTFTTVVDCSVDYTINVHDKGFANTVTLNANENITLTMTKNSEPMEYKLGTEILEPGVYTVKMVDALGNTKELSFTIVNALYGKFEQEIDEMPGFNKVLVNGEEVTIEKGTLSLTASGSYEVTIVANGNEQKFTVVVDSTAPVVTIDGVENGGTTKGAVILSDLSSDATMKVYLDDVLVEYNLGDELTDVGVYRIVLEDAAGNVSEYSFEILWKMPAVAIVLIVIAALGVVGTVVWLVISKKRKDEYYN